MAVVPTNEKIFRWPSKRKGGQRRGQCVYCTRKNVIITRDHVFPQVLFKELDSQMLTVPSCTNCQREKERGDWDLRVYLNMDIDGSKHEDNLHHLERMTDPDENPALREFIQSWIDSSQVGLIREHVGVGLEEAIVGDFDQSRLYRTLRMMIRALCFVKTHEVLPPDTTVRIVRVERHEIVPLLLKLRPHQNDLPIVTGNKIGMALPYWLSDAPKDGSFWLLGLHNQVLFQATTGELRTHLEELKTELPIISESVSPDQDHATVTTN